MTRPRPLRYVAIGDSLSEGVGDDPWPNGALRGWTDRLAQLLQDDTAIRGGAVEYANLAVRGYKAAQVREGQLANAIAMSPDLVTLTAGMNDILRPRIDFDVLRSNLVDLVTPFIAHGARVVIVPIPDIRGISPAGRLINSRRLRLNSIYRDLEHFHGVLPLTDTTGSVFEDSRAWAEDRLHLSPLGHERLAYAAAASFGMSANVDWISPPDGLPPRRTVRSEFTWWRRHVAPWIGRRLRGKSSGDCRTAKRPTLERFTLA